MEPLSLSQNQLGRDLGVPITRINEIIKGKRAITTDTALRLSRYFGTSPESWLNLQQEYDLRIARRELWPGILKRVRARTARPVKA
jgi:addiction module HigA family antidote